MTDNHSYAAPTKGTADWHVPLNENFHKIDRDVEVRDVDANRDRYQPKVGAKFLATDLGTVYVGDGSQWQQIGSLVTDTVEAKRVNDVNYANQYRGADLTAKVQAAIDDLPDGSGRVVVPPKAGGGPWSWSTWRIDPTDYNGVHIDFAGPVEVRYGGSGYAITVDSRGDISSQIRGSSLRLTGGQWQATASPSGFVRVVDLIRGHFAPTFVTGFTNGAGDSTVYSVEIDSKWTENNYFSGIVHMCDIGIEFKPSSNTSFVDNTVEDFSVGAKVTAAVLRGNLSGVEFSNFVFFPREDGATGVELDDWNLNGCQFNSPRFDNVSDKNGTVAFKATGNYSSPGPMVLNPIMPTMGEPYSVSGSGDPLYTMRPVGNDFYLDNLHPDGGTLVLDQSGHFDLYDSDANPVFRVSANGAVVKGGNYNTGEPPVFNDNLKLSTADLRGRDPLWNEIAFHDGSGGYSLSLCFYTNSGWYNVVDGTVM